MPGLTTHYVAVARDRVAAWPCEPGIGDLNELLRTLAWWRAQILANTFIARQGARILSGPFAGMEYLTGATEGTLIARLLGTYESELHPHLAAFTDAGIDTVLDVGCAEGYYAVGLARAMPAVTVYAYDTDGAARQACAALAAKNGVAERVIIRGELRPQDLESFTGRRVLMIVDAEGAEVDILQPVPALAQMNIIVETHDIYRPGALATLMARFSHSHDIVRVDQQPKVFDPPQWLRDLPHLDQLLAVWEWRAGPTPWLVMTPKPAS